MGTIRNTMSDLERVVYDLAEAGALDAAHAVLYPRPIGRLVRAGLLVRDEHGGYRAVRAATDTRPPPARVTPPPFEQARLGPVGVPARAPSTPPPAPREAPLVTLVVRVPQEWVDTLDGMGPDRSTAARALLRRALSSASGTRQRVTPDGRVRDEHGRYARSGSGQGS
jgi:hypothetical protein